MNAFRDEMSTAGTPMSFASPHLLTAESGATIAESTIMSGALAAGSEENRTEQPLPSNDGKTLPSKQAAE